MGLGVETRRSLSFVAVELLSAGEFYAELERLEDTAAALELVGRQLRPTGEGGEGGCYITAGGGVCVLGMSRAHLQERLCGDAVALESGLPAVGVGSDPLAQRQPVPAAVPGRGSSAGACGNRQRQCGARAGRLGFEQVLDGCLGRVVLVLSSFDCSDVRYRGSNDRFPFLVSERLGEGEVDITDLGRHAGGRRKLNG
ncbi:hypothetical protein Y013_26245 (plasmid) [Rhodococcus pyridinivorans SB3094]|uniref:Uncharacterized protein n=1 Tax=Rhodococcus pyridinivorans SB3094 TaxID=1435356 RepID=V9XLM1_9NOCA|nr:hypothetical protein Y013_26245 [Rhodococcus pyridinivorans SB3094]